MKRVMVFSLILLGLILALSTTSAPAANRSTERVGIGVETFDQEIGLLGRSSIVSQAPPCVACLALAGACSGGTGTVCNEASRCTCQWCGGKVMCRPTGRIPPFPEE
jgi:hypothetical protein